MTILLHPDRYNPCYPDQYRKLGVVVHDSESGDGSSASLVTALQSPGYLHPDGGVYGAGYHAVTDGLGGYVQVADATCGPFAAPPVNYTWWHVCMPGRANQTRDDWLDQLSRAHIRGVAKFIVDAWKWDDKTWSPFFLFADQLQRGLTGYTSHYQVSLAWRKSTHTDPGLNFPWDVLASDIHALTRPPLPENPIPVSPTEEEDMYLANLSDGSVVVVGSSVRPVSSDEISATGPYAKLPRFTPDPGSNWHAWLRAGLDEYLTRVTV